MNFKINKSTLPHPEVGKILDNVLRCYKMIAPNITKDTFLLLRVFSTIRKIGYIFRFTHDIGVY